MVSSLYRFAFLLTVFWSALILGATAQDKSLLPEPLHSVPTCPEGVRFTAGPNYLEVEIGGKDAPFWRRGKEFYMVLPFGEKSQAEFVDYRLEREEGKANADAPEVLTPEDEEKYPQLKKRMDQHYWLDMEEIGVVRFWRLFKAESNRGPMNVGLPVNYRIAWLKARFPFKKNYEPPKTPFFDWQKGYASLLHHIVANPEQLALYAHRQGLSPNTPPRPDCWIPGKNRIGNWFKVLIEKDDVYRLTGKHFREAGLDPAAINPYQVQLFSRGQEVPCLPLVPPGEKLDAGLGVVFYGLGSESPYSTERAYWVQVSPETPGNTPSLPLKPNPTGYPLKKKGVVKTHSTMRVEEDEELLIEHGSFLSIQKSHWVWMHLTDGENKRWEIPFDLPFRDPLTTEALTLEMEFYFEGSVRSNPPLPANAPPLRVRLNDSPPKTVRPFKNLKDTTRDIAFAPEFFRAKGNRLFLEFDQPLDPSQTNAKIYFDFLTIDYWRNLIPVEGRLQLTSPGHNPWLKTAGFMKGAPLVLDITDPEKPVALEAEPLPITKTLPIPTHAIYCAEGDRSILAVSPQVIPEAPQPLPFHDALNLRESKHECDYLIIYHDPFQEIVAPLQALHQSQGYQVKSVPISAVYQDFSEGEVTPHAIKDFLFYTLQNWRRPPSYVCLVGDATSDYRNQLKNEVDNQVPTYSFDAGLSQIWASDFWFTTLTGKDLLADIILGRISARYPEDAREMIQKVVEFSRSAPLGPWRGRMGFCADDTGFRGSLDRLKEEFTPLPMSKPSIYLEETIYEDNFYLPDPLVEQKNLKVSTDATLQILKTLNQGVSMMMFMGHGSPNIWTDERIWFGGDSPNSDNVNLQNGNRMPFVATFTCNQGAFDYPKPKWHICISEDMMRPPEGGAIAMYVPSGPGFTTVHEKIAEALLQAIFREGKRRVGDAVTLSRLNYILDNEQSEMLRMFILLGDPLVKLPFPQHLGNLETAPASISTQILPENPEAFLMGETPNAGEGSFQVLLVDPEGRSTVVEEKALFSGGIIRCNVPVPADAVPGKWTVRLYYADEKTGEDGLLQGVFKVERPLLKLERLAWVESPKGPKDRGRMAVELVNESGVALREGRLTLGLVGPDGSWDDWKEERRLDLAPGEKETLHFTPRPNKVLSVFQALLDERFLLPSAVEEGRQPSRHELVAFLPEGDKGPEAYFHPALAKASLQSTSGKDQIRLTVPLFLAGLTTTTAAQVALYDGDKALGQLGAQLSNTPSADAPFQAHLILSAPQKTLAGKTFNLRLSGNNGLEKNWPLPMPTVQSADLAVVPETAAFDRQEYVEGETVFLRFQVENRGTLKAPAFRIQGNEKRERGGSSPLKSLPSVDQWKQEPLGAGQKRWVKLRWDYKAGERVAGKRTVSVELDPGNKVADPNRDNNLLMVDFQVLRKAEVKVTDIQREEKVQEDGTRLGRLEAVVENVGEGRAINRQLGFFRKEPTGEDDFSNPDYLLEERLLPPLPGHYRETHSLEWEMGGDDSISSATVKVYRTLKTIRAIMEQQPENYENW